MSDEAVTTADDTAGTSLPPVVPAEEETTEVVTEPAPEGAEETDAEVSAA